MLRSVRSLFFGLLPVLMLYLSGCGGSGNSTSDPLGNTPASSNQADQTGTQTATPVTAQDPVFALELSTDLKRPTDLSSQPQIDSDNGTVLLTAKLLNVAGGVFLDPLTNQRTEAGSPVPNQAVNFKVLAGPGAISYVTPLTDKNGEAKAVLATGNVPSTTNVIVEASVTVDGKNYHGYTGFQVVRGTGVIMFTDAAGLKPGEQSSMLAPKEKEVDPTVTESVTFLQLIPFKLTDANGNPRAGVPVTLSVYNSTGDTSDIELDPVAAAGPGSQTVTTDAAGMGIFNVSVTMLSPELDSFTAGSVVFKAVTNDSNPITGYVGGSYALASSARPLTITPSAAGFDTATELVFSVGGGAKPFTVTSSAPGRVTAALGADGVTITAGLADASPWSGSVKITVSDSAGQSATASLTR